MFRNTPAWLATPTDSLRYSVYCRAYAAATAIRLTLPDALDDDRLAISAVHWIGAFVLAITGGLVGWVLCAGAIVLAFVLGEDQLTQSAFLFGCALAAIAAFVVGRRDDSFDPALALSVRVLTAGTYGIAVFHKLNRDFFDPAVSCAAAGVEILGDNWGVIALENSAPASWWPWAFVATELLVVALLLWRPILGMVLALGMHIPLTIVFAPSFAFVMMSGWVCFFRDEDLTTLWKTLRRRAVLILGVGFALGGGSFVLYLRNHDQVYPVWSFKEALLWVALVWFITALIATRGAIGERAAWSSRSSKNVRRLGIAIGLLWLLNGLMPYSGLRFHHSGSMLSNLRVDPGCWNSAVVPEQLRIVDPYIRIDEVEVQRGEVSPTRREELEVALWNRGALRRAAAKLCRDDASIVISGSAGGQSFSGVELCSERWPFGGPWIPDARPFQENLDRECPQACIH